MTDLWTYWEKEMPYWIEVCLASIRLSCSSSCQFHLLTPENYAEFISSSSVPEEIWQMHHPAHRADYFRAAVLAKYGGFYFDADTVGIQCPSSLGAVSDGQNLSADLLHIVWNKPPRRVPNGYVYCRPGSPLAVEWLAEAGRIVRETPPGMMPWTAIGETLLTGLVSSGRFSTREVPLSTFLPIDIDTQPKRLFSRIPMERILTPEVVCVGLNHSWLMDKFSSALLVPPEAWARSPRIVHRLLTRSYRRMSDAG